MLAENYAIQKSRDFGIADMFQFYKTFTRYNYQSQKDFKDKINYWVDILLDDTRDNSAVKAKLTDQNLYRFLSAACGPDDTVPTDKINRLLAIYIKNVHSLLDDAKASRSVKHNAFHSVCNLISIIFKSRKSINPEVINSMRNFTIEMGKVLKIPKVEKGSRHLKENKYNQTK